MQVAAVLLVGFFMNSYEYNGSFTWGLSVNQIYFAMAIPAAIMVPLSYFGIKEEVKESQQTFKQYIGSVYELLSGKAMFFVIIYQAPSCELGPTASLPSCVSVWREPGEQHQHHSGWQC